MTPRTPAVLDRARLSPAARVIAPALVLAVGVLATVAGMLLDSQRTDEQLHERMEAAADRFSAELTSELDRYADVARAARVVFDHHDTPTAVPSLDEWQIAADQLDLATRYPALTGLNAVLPSGPGLSGDWTVTVVAPVARNRSALGFNIRENPLAEEAARAAAVSGLSTMTEPITLAQETGDALGFVIYVPMYDAAAPLGSEAQRIEAFTGWTQAVFRGPDVIDAVAATADGLWVEVAALTGDDAVTITTVGADPSGASTTRELARFGQRWQVTFRPTAAFLATGVTGYGDIILALGVPATLLLTALVAALARSDRRARELVEERTAELRRREQRFRTLTSTSPTGTFELDASGAPSYANAQLTGMLGWTGDDGRGAWRRTIHADDLADFDAAWEDVLTRDRPVAVTLRVHAPDTTVHHVRIRIVPLHDEQTRIGFIGTVEDLSSEIAAQTRAEAAAEQARERAAQLAALNDRLEEANQRLQRTVSERDELTAVVAHDVRSPLTIIGGFAETIEKLDGPRLSPPSRDFLARIRQRTQDLEALVDDLVLGSRLGAGAVTPTVEAVDVGGVARELAAEILGEDARVEVNGDCTAQADPRHVRRVLVNLLVNATKHGGPPVEVSVHGGRDGVVTSVTDHGRGVPADVAARLFQRFAGGDVSDVEPGSGAGLGLSIVADLVALNGGTVWHEAVEPHGARFSVRFPTAVHSRTNG